jgi:branched-chain amino acid aminotransferase
VKASTENRLLEAFGAGTAAIVSPVEKIHYKGKVSQIDKTQKLYIYSILCQDIDIPLDPSNPKETIGPLAKRVVDTIMGIQYGEIPHEWSVVVD